MVLRIVSLKRNCFQLKTGFSRFSSLQMQRMQGWVIRGQIIFLWENRKQAGKPWERGVKWGWSVGKGVARGDEVGWKDKLHPVHRISEDRPESFHYLRSCKLRCQGSVLSYKATWVVRPMANGRTGLCKEADILLAAAHCGHTHCQMQIWAESC